MFAVSSRLLSEFLPQLTHLLVAGGDVSQESRDTYQLSAGIAEKMDGELYRDRRPVLAHRGYGQEVPGAVATMTAGHHSLPSGPVSVPKPFRDNQIQ